MKKDVDKLSGYETRKISRIRRNSLSHQNIKIENESLIGSYIKSEKETNKYTQNRLHSENVDKDAKKIKKSIGKIGIIEKIKKEKDEKKNNQTINKEEIEVIPVTKEIKKEKIKSRRTNKVKTQDVETEDIQENEEKQTSNKEKRPAGSKPVYILAILSCVILFFMVVGIIGAGFFAKKLCEGMPEFDPADLESSDSSIIYDADGNEIIELGLYLRENIEYEDLPTCLVDAFVSIEDSRFFEHFGFDIPRFTAAALTNLRSGDFSQGGSTINMQLIKNSYFQVDADDESTMASRSGMSGIQRKMQEIVLAIQADKTLTKQQIISLYINKVNFGDNIRGVQKAAEYYFGKDAKDLSINEAAFLAGIINSPNSCNPYNEAEKYNGTNAYLNPNVEYLENANDRKNEVLDLMLYHGYITEDECKLNKQVRIEDLLAGKDVKFEGTNTYYQSYIDAVINEVEEVTGKNPYTTPMNIYTSMDSHMQKFLYDMQNTPEFYEEYYKFRNDLQQNALVVLNNQTGELVALGGGRNQANKARQFNRAVDAYINPGSSIKPILEYALAFDRLGYSTSHTITDKPIFMYGTVLIANAYGQSYTGDMLITEALARSLNTPAVQLLEEVTNEIGDDEVIKYCQDIGFINANKNTFDLQWAIGGKDCTVSPVQLASAHAVLMNKGKYIKPHTIKKIEYRGAFNKLDDYMPDISGKQVLSEAAAWMTAYCENYNVTSGWIGQLKKVQRDYPTYAKTGTTTFPDSAYYTYHIPESGAKDQWLMCQTSNYTITVWNGFDKLEDKAFFTYEDENYNLKCKMGSLILDEIYDHFKYEPHEIEKPDDCIEITFVKGTFPYASGGDTKGYIKEDSPYAKLIPLSEVKQTVLPGVFTGIGGNIQEDGIINLFWAGFGGDNGDGTMDISASNYNGTKTVVATGRCYWPRIVYTRPQTFYANITSASGISSMIETSEPFAQVYVEGGGPYTVCGWTSNDATQKCATIK